jgi:hypothetical protein
VLWLKGRLIRCTVPGLTPMLDVSHALPYG